MNKTFSGHNPRWVAFCLKIDNPVHIFTESLGAMFINWINKKWIEWEKSTGRHCPYLPIDHDEFEKWLDGKK